jgi:hypothetical protein
MDGPTATKFVADQIRGAWSAPFRGEIYHYANKLDLQKGYAVKGAFDIHSARHLIEPLQAIRNPRIRLVSIRAAVQSLKSLICDITVPYWIEHDPGDTLWLFEDDPKAKLYADSRAMPLIQSIPAIARMLEGIDRHDQTKTRIKFRHMNLVMCGLNEGNVQSISYRYVIIDESWMAKSNGLIRQAKERAKQYPETKKIIILGQGGLENEDADLEHRQTDQRELNYSCPACGFIQPFELSRQRPPDFPIAKLRGTYAGLSWDTNGLTRPGGPEAPWNYHEVGLSAHHRCYNCDHRIDDTPDTRRQLADSYRYIPTNPGAPEDSAGFHWPAEASTRISFADLAVKYLRAKVAADELGYRLPLQEFWQKDRGQAWSDGADIEYQYVPRESYDPETAWKHEAFRPLIIDCQRDLSKFFYSVYAVALDGETRELARGTADGFDYLATVQKQFKVRDQHVFIDCGYQMTKVLRECVKHGHIGAVKIAGKVRKIWLCWTGLKGSGQELFLHYNPKTKLKEWRIYSQRKFYDTNIGAQRAGRQPRSPWYEWSNLHAKDLFIPRRDGDPSVPKFLSLPDTLPPSDINSYYAQLRSEKRHEDYINGRKRAIYKPITQTRPNHRLDVCAMLMIFQAIVGIIGSADNTDTQPDPDQPTPIQNQD